MMDKTNDKKPVKVNLRKVVTDTLFDRILTEGEGDALTLDDETFTPATVKRDPTNPYAFQVVCEDGRTFRVVVKEVELPCRRTRSSPAARPTETWSASTASSTGTRQAWASG